MLADRTEYVLEDISFRTFDEARRNVLARFVDIVRSTETTVTVKKSARLTVGRFTIGKYVIVLPAPLPTDVFVQFLLYAIQGDIRRFHPEDFSGMEIGSLRHDYFLVLMAKLLVEHAKNLLHGHISRSYRRQEVLGNSIRGKVIWARSLGRHPSEGIVCETFDQTSDDLINRLILAGLEAAAYILRGSSSVASAGTQLFIWRQLASRRVPVAHDFDAGDRMLSRLTERYRAPLALARALTLGLAPRSLDLVGNASLNHLEFYIPKIFELFLVKLLSPYARRHGLSLDFKTTDQRALVDGFGATYREIEPDIIVYKGDIPVGVIDAKYKPRYVTRLNPSTDAPEAKVTNADIYQLFFYQSRLQVLHKLATPPRAVIIAPLLSELGPPSVVRRTIKYSDVDGLLSATSRLSVLPIALTQVLSSLRTRSELETLDAFAPEIAAELRLMAAQTVP
ncbi:5-methylcytosine restriction system specificity protein McrC [Burkholderia gladioli]|uniref:5-methylcytosine restriction system specificity protein McrC n=1 Tax=Burkholderia gladioli TaxID=28095 RepID=UPI0018B00DD5|nr:hypothetical protein [Burkholderia gladioli]